MIIHYGDYFNTSGYAIHSRNLVRAINKLHPVKLTTPCPNELVKDLKDDELEMLKRTGEGDINLIITMPMYWKMYLNDKRNFVFMVFEGTKIPKSFLLECFNKRIEKVLCPSNHTIQATLNTLNDLSEEECKEILDQLK